MPKGMAFFVCVKDMKEFARSFYLSSAWRSCRKAYISYCGGLCERCLAKGLYVPGRIVHHRIHLTPNNIHNPLIALDFANLELLCDKCHNAEHEAEQKEGYRASKRNSQTTRYSIDSYGRIKISPLSEGETAPEQPAKG